MNLAQASNLLTQKDSEKSQILIEIKKLEVFKFRISYLLIYLSNIYNKNRI